MSDPFPNPRLFGQSYANIAAGAITRSSRSPSHIPSTTYPPTPWTPPEPERFQMSRQERRYSVRAELEGESSASHSQVNGATTQLETSNSGPSDRPRFFCPTYLERSRHVHRLLLQHNAEDRSKADDHEVSTALPSSSINTSTTDLLRTRSSSIPPPRLRSASIPPIRHHRGVSQRVIERPSTHYARSTRPQPLPARWNRGDAATGVEVFGDGGEVRFSGAHFKLQDEAACIRSDVHVPREVGLYYYEVTIMSRSKDAQVGVGFAMERTTLTRLPGWEADSFAYHGDDGEVFSGQSSGRPLGPRLLTHDVVGCGINFRTNSVFFTRNGNFLGTPYSDIKLGDYYPIIGLKKNGDHARANFGQDLFVFDIDSMMAQERQIALGTISRQDTSKLHPPDDEPTLIQNLITQYLAHEGYVETSRAFQVDLRERRRHAPSTASDSVVQDSIDDVHATQRQKIRGAMLEGDVDRALKYTQMYYPQVLQDQRNKRIYFRLRCRKLIEMMRRGSELSAALELNNTIDENQVDTQMELDNQLQREVSREVEMDISSSDVPFAPTKESELIHAAISYGQGLRDEFESDSSSEFKKELDIVFSLFAYNDARTSDEVRHLVDKSGRSALAEELNGAILVSLGKPSSAALERLCVQTDSFLDDVASKNGGAAAFINVRQDFLIGT